MAARARRPDLDFSPGVRSVGRGPGVRASSSSSIQIDFVWRRQRYRERLRLPPTPKNLKYAARLKATIDHEIAIHTFDYAKHFPESPRVQTLAGISISAALKQYCNGLPGSLEPETIAKYRLDADTVAEGLGTDKPLSALTRADVREWIIDSDLSKKRLDNLLTPLRGALRQALEDGSITSDPLAGFRIRRASVPRETIDPFTPGELESLGTTALGALWKFWSWTGLRSGEVIGLEWRDIDGERMHIQRAVRVGREKAPKTATGRRSVTLLPAAKAALDGLRQPSSAGAVFINPNTGKRWHEDRGLARAFRLACKACGVRYRYPYQLRHTFATWALSSGENPAWIARYMGHADVMMLFRVYGKWMPSLDPQAGSRMARAAGKAA